MSARDWSCYDPKRHKVRRIGFLGFLWGYPECIAVDANPWRREFFYGITIGQMRIGVIVNRLKKEAT